MRKNVHKLKNDWLLCSLIFNIAIVSVFTSCHTTSKNPFFVVDQAFVIQWSYLASQQKTRPVTSFIYRKGEHLLRMDFVIPFRGTIGRLVLNQNKILFQMPLKKEFYEGEFHSQLFLPQFDSFPATWLFAILKAKPLKNWKCFLVSKIKTRCKIGDWTAEWIFEDSHWKEAYLVNGHQEKIKIKKMKELRKKFNKDIFSLSTKGYKKQKILSWE